MWQWKRFIVAVGWLNIVRREPVLLGTAASGFQGKIWEGSGDCGSAAKAEPAERAAQAARVSNNFMGLPKSVARGPKPGKRNHHEVQEDPDGPEQEGRPGRPRQQEAGPGRMVEIQPRPSRPP